MTNPPVDLLDAAAQLRTGGCSSVDLTRACLDRIAARDGALHAFITVTADEALAAAARADAELAAGTDRGALHGIPVSIKDLVDMVGTPTTSASAVPPRRPRRDAPVIQHLRRAGAVIVGKTNLHEFAFGTTSDETAFGAIAHPLDPARSPGGSSGGAAVSIVERMAYGALGTDTGGSIRIPAAACGITGLKPGYGEVSAEAVVPLSTSLDHVGPLARTVGDCRALYLAMRDGQAPLPGVAAAAPARPRLAIPRPYFFDKLDDGMRRVFEQAAAKLAGGGCVLSDVRIPLAEHTADVYLHIVLPESAWYHAPLLERHADGYAPGVRLRIEMGRYVLAEDYRRALHAREMLRRMVDRAMQGVDALFLPALAIGAPVRGAASVEVGSTREPVRAIMLRLTQLFNITGHPAIVIPAGVGEDGLPRGVQLVGHRGGTERLLDVAAVVEAQMAGGDGSVGGGAG